MRNRQHGNLFVGLLIVAIGVFFLLKNFGLIPYHIDLGDLWPVALLVVGGGMIVNGIRKRSGSEEE